MGYESEGYGEIQVRDIYDPEFIVEILEDEHCFEVNDIKGVKNKYSKNKYSIRFSGFKLYNESDREAIEYLVKTCNGWMNVDGDS